jgi:hypothetical protein
MGSKGHRDLVGFRQVCHLARLKAIGCITARCRRAVPLSEVYEFASLEFSHFRLSLKPSFGRKIYCKYRYFSFFKAFTEEVALQKHENQKGI